MGWLSVRRDRAALGLLFVLPVVFFSIFAFIFGRVGGGGVGEGMAVLAVDEDRSPMSRHLLAALQRQRGIRLKTEAEAEDAAAGPAFAREAAAWPVRQGKHAAA
ncbi:MAG: hypothetical protein ABSG53_12340, partial [Thermoguttaceae bacterium]